MDKTLTIRHTSEAAYQRFAEMARKNHRTIEACGHFFIERQARREPLQTCGEILDAYANLPPPKVKLADIEFHQTHRKRRRKFVLTK